MTTTAARRYAEALLDAVWDQGDEARAAVAEELNRLVEATRQVFDLRNALENPSYALDERLKVLDGVAEQLELSGRTRNFARLVVERGRASELPAMLETFERLLDARTGRVKATVTSAAALDEATADRLKLALEKRTGKSVEMSLHVDPALIGGIRAEVGTTIFDGSIRAELARLRDSLAPS